MEELFEKFYLHQQQQNLPLIEYVNDMDEHMENMPKSQRCIGSNCFTKFFKSGKKRKDSIIIPPLKTNANTLTSVDDEWTLGFILLQIWRKYPYAMLSIFISIFVLIFATVWMCGRHVN